jgi:hypothetical protein
VTREEQLAWEERTGRLVAPAAFLSALLSVASVVAYNGTVGSYSDSSGLLHQIHLHPGGAVAASVLQALAVLLLAPIMYYVFRATRWRRSETPPIALILVLAGPVAAAVLSVATTLLQIHAATKFSHLGPLFPKSANDHADHYIRQGAAPVVGYLGLLAGFAVGAGVAVISLNAMRAGLLSKFMGILGVILGVLTAIPIFFGGPSVIQFFWLIALGILILDRWPGGRGPAWDSGEAIPWPTAADRRQELQPTAERRQPTQTATATVTEQPRSKKKKRKRRR